MKLSVANWGASGVTFGMALAYLVQLIVTFYWLREELPEGTLLRAAAGSLLLFAITALAIVATPMVSAIVLLFLSLVLVTVIFIYVRRKSTLIRVVAEIK